MEKIGSIIETTYSQSIVYLMGSNYFNAIPLSPSIGIEINGLDLSQQLSKITIEELRSYWLKYKLLIFRNQNLEPQHQLSFTGRFGEIDRYPFLHGLPDFPDVAPVLKRPEDELNFGGVWHSDTAYLECPAAGATLYALEVPDNGGDTIFVDMAAVYTSLPQRLKAQIVSSKAENISGKAAVSKTRKISNSKLADSEVEEFRQVHPVVRTHPETGEKILYVNQAHTTCLVDQPSSVSEEILNEVFSIIRNSQYRYQMKWERGTLIMWDNRATQHYPLNDYPGCRRLLHRVSLKGDKPF